MTIVKEVKQLDAITKTLCEQGFYPFLKPLFLQGEPLSTPEKAPSFFKTKQDLLNHFIKALKTLGSPYTQFAEKLYYISDRLPISWCEAFSELKGAGVSFPFEKAIAVIQTELGGRIETYFSSIEKTPIECTYFSQTYRAQLKTGENVFVKVVRPESQGEVERSFEVVSHLSEQIYRAFDFAKENVVPLLDSLRESLYNELNLEQEFKRREMLYNRFQNEKDVIVPKVFTSYSKKRVLTIEAVAVKSLPEVNQSVLQKLIFEMGLIPLLPQMSQNETGIFVLNQKDVWFLSLIERQALAQLVMGFKENNLFLTIVALQRLSPNPIRFLDEEIQEGIDALMLSERERSKNLLMFLSDRNILLNPGAYLALKNALL